jgi:hypothetical protein
VEDDDEDYNQYEEMALFTNPLVINLCPTCEAVTKENLYENWDYLYDYYDSLYMFYLILMYDIYLIWHIFTIIGCRNLIDYKIVLIIKEI